MNGIRRVISLVFGVLALIALAGGAVLLLRAQETGPVQEEALAQPASPLRTPTAYVEPTAPSENWPTLAPPPTWVMPTPQGTPVVKPGETPIPAPTRPPLLLTPIPEGQPPADLSRLYYVADTDRGPELHAIGMDAQGRRWSDSSVAINVDEPLGILHLSPDGRYLAVGGWGMNGSVYIVGRSSGRVWCPLREPATCQGRFLGWLPGNRFLFQPDVTPEGVVPMGVMVVDLETGQYTPLDLPIESRWGYSLAQNVSPSPDGSWLAYSVTYPENEKEISEIWKVQMDGQDEQLIRRVEGGMTTLSWSPTGGQLVYLYQPGTMRPSTDPYELWLLNSDGTGERLLAHGQCYGPTWSPDGRHVAFVQADDPGLYFSDWRGPGTNIYVADTTTGQITRLSSFEGRSNSYPAWSPDGKFVAFVSAILVGEPEMYSPGLVYVEVWVASVDGSQLYAVSGNARWSSPLTWLPAAFSVQEQ
jgi:Tol biopolymer transport system component